MNGHERAAATDGFGIEVGFVIGNAGIFEGSDNAAAGSTDGGAGEGGGEGPGGDDGADAGDSEGCKAEG